MRADGGVGVINAVQARTDIVAEGDIWGNAVVPTEPSYPVEGVVGEGLRFVIAILERPRDGQTYRR